MESTVANQIKPSQVSGRLATWHRVMEEAGLPYEALQWPIDDPEMRKKLVSFWLEQKRFTVISGRAHDIMGENYFGVEHAIKYFGAVVSLEEQYFFGTVPYSEETLFGYRDTHILVAVLPMSILEIRHKAGNCYLNIDPGLQTDAFANEKGKAQWRLVRKSLFPFSNNKSWHEQYGLLIKKDETSTVQVMVYTILGYFFKTGERIFDSHDVRCSDVDSTGNHVAIGNFRGAGGLSVHRRWDDNRTESSLGVASARRSDR